ncbi:hypothetical protein D3OALGB2SA_4417 [Olavius algarvensis associated proteobacterium Delta 3]|nr:hypothetical protein D3OALGB2SA_4417 [Olavius algarvensis associated proteobacterium Delta 3]
MATHNVQKTGYVKTQTLLFAVFVSFFVGFFAGIVLTILKTDQMPTAAQQPANPQQRQEAHATRILQLEQETSANPKNTAAWIQLGHLYFDTEQYTEAIRTYRVALEQEPDNADVWTDLGVMYRRTKQPEEAIKAFDQALKVDPRHKIAMYNKGIVLIHDLKDNKADVESWSRLVAIDPQASAPNGVPVSTLIREYSASP